MGIDRTGSNSYIICTSSTRPASPAEGVIIYETDTNLSYYYDSAAWRLNGVQVVGHSALGGSAASISITLPSITNGLHLIVETLVQSDTTSNDITLQPNGDNTSGNYFHQFMYGQNATAAANQSAATGARMSLVDNGSTYWANGIAWVFNYAGSGQKTIQTNYGSPYGLTTTAVTLFEHCVWKSTAAITSITIKSTAASSNLRAGSMATVKVIGSI